MYNSLQRYISLECVIRTNIEIDDTLMAEALRLTDCRTKREVVDSALRIVVKLAQQRAVLDLAGKISWEGDLDAMRASRTFEET